MLVDPAQQRRFAQRVGLVQVAGVLGRCEAPQHLEPALGRERVDHRAQGLAQAGLGRQVQGVATLEHHQVEGEQHAAKLGVVVGPHGGVEAQRALQPGLRGVAPEPPTGLAQPRAHQLGAHQQLLGRAVQGRARA